MKFSTLLLIICLLAIPLIVSAATNTNTTNTTVNVTATLLVPEEFYGTVLYSDNSPVPSGSEIIAKDQQGKIIGNFTMIFNGSYGESYASASRLIVRADDVDDMITFYIGTSKSSIPPRKFDSGAIKRSDIVIDISAKNLLSQIQEPTPTPAQEPTSNTSINPTPVLTQSPITSSTPSLVSIVAVTGNVTFPPTPVQTTMTFPITTLPTPTPVPTQKISTPTPASNTTILDDTTIKFLGVLLVGIGICVVGAIITYYILTKKMKRDDDEEIIL